MEVIINLYCINENDIKNFLNKYYEKNLILPDPKQWSAKFSNPLESIELLGTLIDNNNKYNINMWICFDKDFFINVTDYNADKIIRYLYERYPY